MMCLIHGKVKVYKEGVGGRNQIVRIMQPDNDIAQIHL